MTHIIKSNKNTKKEDINIIPFLDYYCSHLKKDVVFRDFPEEGRPDYFIETLNTLVEIKEIHDRASNERHAQWGKVINKLQKATDLNSDRSTVKGTYLVNTPEVFKLHRFEDTAIQIIKNIVSGVNKRKVIDISGINFEINKVSDRDSVVVYGSMGGAGFIDPANIVFQNIQTKVSKANKQLNFEPNSQARSKKILLLVNKYYFPLFDWDLFKAISMIYNDLINFKSINEIWYQLETKDKGYVHKLLYRRSFFEKFRSGGLSNVQKDEYKMFASWFSALSEMGDEYKHKLLKALQFFLKQNKASSIFPDDADREQMVKLGLWLVEKNLIKEANWLINQFINDPDPVDPGKYKGKLEFNYDQKVREGNDEIVITSVMGHLAWVVKELARKSDRHNTANLIKAFEYTEKVLNSSQNLYVILQWIVPLVEISNRRLWIAEDNQEVYQRFRKLILDKEDGLITKYSKYSAIAKLLIDLFDFFKDLTTEDVKFILDKLDTREESYRLFFYFALYRSKHYKNDSDVGKVLTKMEPKIFEYSPVYAKKRLKEISQDKEEKYSGLRSQLAWQCWRTTDELPEEFDHLTNLMNNLFNSPYDKNVFSNLFHVLEEKYEQKPEQCHKWLKVFIHKLSMYAATNDKGFNVWVDMDEIVKKVVRYQPKDLPIILETLTNIWLRSAYIGDLNTIYTAYQNIEDQKLRQRVKKISQKLYKQIQNSNSQVKDIDWI